MDPRSFDRPRVQDSRFARSRWRRLASGAPLSVGGNLAPDYAPVSAGDFVELEVCQYDNTPQARQFKQWYNASPAERAVQGIEHPDLEPTRRERANNGSAF